MFRHAQRKPLRRNVSLAGGETELILPAVRPGRAGRRVLGRHPRRLSARCRRSPTHYVVEYKDLVISSHSALRTLPAKAGLPSASSWTSDATGYSYSRSVSSSGSGTSASEFIPAPQRERPSSVCIRSLYIRAAAPPSWSSAAIPCHIPLTAR